jgi:hypothetical protein
MKSFASVRLAGYLVLYQRDITKARIQRTALSKEGRERFVFYDDLQIKVSPRVSFAPPERTGQPGRDHPIVSPEQVRDTSEEFISCLDVAR